jgi:UMF1 family MFS transporter
MASENINPSLRVVRAWQMYDWANSAFATVMMTSCLPLYFAAVANAGQDGEVATARWSALAAISMALIAVVALFMGPVADAAARKKRYLGLFMGLGVATTTLIGVGPANWLLISLLFILGRLGFGGGNIFYDALLPAVAPRDQLDKVSSTGYALGYLGGGSLLAVCVALILFFPMQQIEVTGEAFPILAMRISFVLVAIWWAVFSIPLFRRVPEPPVERSDARESISLALRRLGQTIRSLGSHKEMLKFLAAFWLYSDGVGTIIIIAVAYAKGIFSAQGIENASNHLIAAVLMVQFVGIPCTLIWGRIAQRIGAKASVLICLAFYGGICVLGYFMADIWHFYALAAGVAFVQGGTQALSRSLFARLIPAGRESEFFGFYNISGKFAGILGPAFFALMGADRKGILALIAFFALGGIVLAMVRIPRD